MCMSRRDMPIDSGNYAGEKKAPVDDSRIAKSADLDTEGILKNSMLNEHLKTKQVSERPWKSLHIISNTSYQ